MTPPHRTIGVVGGMSWHSSLEYYRRINELVAERLGGVHSARVLLASVDFADIEACQRTGDWQGAGSQLAAHAAALERAGADLLVLATNTMHLVADQVAAAVDIPFLHIADAIAAEAARLGVARVGLLGTRFTMAEPFLVDALRERDLDPVVPSAAEQPELDRIIFEELVHGRAREDSRATYRRAMAALADEHACGAIVLGCTEIGLLVDPTDSPVPLIDTTAAHARLAVDAALAP